MGWGITGGREEIAEFDFLNVWYLYNKLEIWLLQTHVLMTVIQVILVQIVDESKMLRYKRGSSLNATQ